jgi:hypothetical protein
MHDHSVADFATSRDFRQRLHKKAPLCPSRRFVLRAALASNGLAKANPRRAGLASLDVTDQATPDWPAHVADGHCARVHL